jgi:hypothetical protein
MIEGWSRVSSALCVDVYSKHYDDVCVCERNSDPQHDDSLERKARTGNKNNRKERERERVQ